MTSTTDPRRGLTGLIESSDPHQKDFGAYKKLVKEHYDGPAGAFTAVTGFLTGHETLAGRLIRPGGFDVRGCKSILDAACGNGRYSKFLLKCADPDARLTAFAPSPNLVQRARARPQSDRVTFAIADLTKLPYADGAFDAVVCGWVLEHLPQPEMGLREPARVLQPEGKLLLLCTEDTLTGAMCSRLWHCRTYNRKELRVKAAAVGLRWERELWFSRFHRWLKLGGIIVELHKDGAPPTHEPDAQARVEVGRG